MNSTPNAQDQAETKPVGAASGLFQSLTQLVATLMAMAHTRLELLTTELQEEVHRAANLVIWALLALVTMFVGLFLAALTIIFAFWDSHRLLAALSVTGVFVAIAVISLCVVVMKAKSRPRFLDATLTELKNDASQLQSRS